MAMLTALPARLKVAVILQTLTHHVGATIQTAIGRENPRPDDLAAIDAEECEYQRRADVCIAEAAAADRQQRCHARVDIPAGIRRRGARGVRCREGRLRRGCLWMRGRAAGRRGLGIDDLPVVGIVPNGLEAVGRDCRIAS